MNNPLSTLSRRSLNLLGFFVCIALVAYALYTQYYQYLDPCNLCIFQRMAFIALGLVFLLAAMHNPKGFGNKVYGVLGLIAGGTGIAIAGRHVWLQQNPPEGIPSCGGDLNSLMEMFPFRKVVEIVFSGSGDCTTIDWQFLGLTMPAWSLVWLVALTILVLIANLKN